MKLTTTLAAAAVALTGLVGAASAAVVDYKIDFDTPNPDFVLTSYKLNGSINNSGVGTSNDCGSACAQLSNNEIIGVTLAAPGTFSLYSFLFNGKGGELAAILLSTSLTDSMAGVGTTFDEPNGATTMTMAVPDLDNLTGVYFRNLSKGSARIDYLTDTPAVPVPAAGFLLVGALGALGVARKRRAA